MKLLQLIKDFRKWRKERYNEALSKALHEYLDEFDWHSREECQTQIRRLVKFCLLDRKEILKQVKI